MSTATITTAWYRGMADLCARGVALPGPDNPVLETAWRDFRNLAAMAGSTGEFSKEGPRLAASLAEEAIARDQRGIDSF